MTSGVLEIEWAYVWLPIYLCLDNMISLLPKVEWYSSYSILNLSRHTPRNYTKTHAKLY
jgi:hypothetical protein